MTTALLYHAPSSPRIIGYIFDSLVYCGLIGQILIGIGWGTPGASWISTSMQEVFVQLGYLGLIFLVFEGGLSTSFQSLKSNFFLSACVALTGIMLPIAVSFVLIAIAEATPLQAFAAGAALCSTSLGTTFTVLKTTGLTRSIIGVILMSAAMLDDIVGLVMVQIISNLGGRFSVATVVAPIGVSIAFAVVVPLACLFLIKPIALRLVISGKGLQLPGEWMDRVAFVIHTRILVGFVVASSYAGTSNLFAAYLAGASISWYDSEISSANALSVATVVPPLSGRGNEVLEMKEEDVEAIARRKNRQEGACFKVNGSLKKNGSDGISTSQPAMFAEDGHPASRTNSSEDSNAAQEASTALKQSDGSSSLTGTAMYEKYYQTAVSTILKPLFFASIGFSIPISEMFTSHVIWRGIAYALPMAIGKLLCGVWLVRFRDPAGGIFPNQDGKRNLPRPKSLYPPSILGCAMVARGEIGFLISSIAESHGIFKSGDSSSDTDSSELFLIVSWAIVICTILGPIAVGVLTKRIHRQRKNKIPSGPGD